MNCTKEKSFTFKPWTVASLRYVRKAAVEQITLDDLPLDDLTPDTHERIPSEPLAATPERDTARPRTPPPCRPRKDAALRAAQRGCESATQLSQQAIENTLEIGCVDAGGTGRYPSGHRRTARPMRSPRRVSPMRWGWLCLPRSDFAAIHL